MPPYYNQGAREYFDKARALAQKSISEDTLPIYHSGCRKFREFCVELCPDLEFPLSDLDYSLFYTWLVERISADSAANYLNHVSFLGQIMFRIPAPIWRNMPLTHRCKKSKKAFSVTKRNRKLPITFTLATKIGDAYPNHHPDHIVTMDAVSLFLCILYLGICGLFRCGELIPKNPKKTHPEKLIRRGQIDFFDPPDGGPRFARVWLYRSKGDKFHEGVPVLIPGYTNRKHCPIAWLECLMRLSPKDRAHPIFTFPDHKLVTKRVFIQWVRGRLMSLGFNPSDYAGHSMRAGGAVSASRRGVPDHIIKILGRWKSDSYLLYIKYMEPHLAELREHLRRLSQD